MAVAPSPTDRPVVIVGGLGAPRVAARVYGCSFRLAGFTVFTAPQSFLAHGDVREAARRLSGYVRRVLDKTGADRVHLVGMSLGGLIALVHVKLGDGAEWVDRLLAVGAPLNGSPLAVLCEVAPLGLIRALKQARTDSMLVQELQDTPIPPGVRVLTLGTAGDVVTPPDSREIEGAEAHETPHGVYPVGHWTLFTHPGNVKAAVDLLLGP